jgi:hypothetical protein
MHRPMSNAYIISQTTLWNNIMRLNYNNNALATDDFKEMMQKRTPGGFRTSFYSTSDASLHFKDSRNILCITQHGNLGILPQVLQRYE